MSRTHSKSRRRPTEELELSSQFQLDRPWHHRCCLPRDRENTRFERVRRLLLNKDKRPSTKSSSSRRAWNSTLVTIKSAKWKIQSINSQPSCRERSTWTTAFKGLVTQASPERQASCPKAPPCQTWWLPPHTLEPSPTRSQRWKSQSEWASAKPLTIIQTM